MFEARIVLCAGDTIFNISLRNDAMSRKNFELAGVYGGILQDAAARKDDPYPVRKNANFDTLAIFL